MENKNEAIDFEKEEQRLDEILEKLDNKGLKLDESVKLYKEGTEIVKKLKKALNDLKIEVQNEISE